MRPSVTLDRASARIALVAVLKNAHAGELGAARAYRGHWRSLRDAREAAEVQQIEREELEHRRQVGTMLRELGAAFDARLERRMSWIGSAVSAFCGFGGWFAPMYGAGRLEAANVQEYEDAARFAVLAEEPQLAMDLLRMAEAEWEHERYFRAKVLSHWLARFVPVWEPLMPRLHIWESFEYFLLLSASLGRGRPAA